MIEGSSSAPSPPMLSCKRRSTQGVVPSVWRTSHPTTTAMMPESNRSAVVIAAYPPSGFAAPGAACGCDSSTEASGTFSSPGAFLAGG